jgi:hypothetical protein
MLACPSEAVLTQVQVMRTAWFGESPPLGFAPVLATSIGDERTPQLAKRVNCIAASGINVPFTNASMLDNDLRYHRLTE